LIFWKKKRVLSKLNLQPINENYNYMTNNLLLKKINNNNLKHKQNETITKNHRSIIFNFRTILIANQLINDFNFTL
jgi:hypothetical protein